MMLRRKLLTTVRCLPRCGFAGTEVRLVQLDLRNDSDESLLRHELLAWFEGMGIADAIFDVGVDADGPFAVVNDDAYASDWGDPLL
ncbi:MAG: hypothetical protein IPM64_04805 [Phycisphaerales bacterium]|nr:hypothetical protein [Phycisphaerales bacterium]